MKKKIILLVFLIFTMISCENKSNEIITAIFPDYKSFDYQEEVFDSSPYVSPLIILYRSKMELSEYEELIGDAKYIPNCKEFSGLTYENMKENNYPFEVYQIEWWQPVYNSKPDFVGHYNLEENKFTDCSESREYKYAYKYLDGYCYLIIENTGNIVNDNDPN